ncbi:MAG: hypothetical protein ACK5LT_01095 [Lachnospirales bacterium]
MDITVRCRRCRKPFSPYGKVGSLCNACLASEEEDYNRVRNFIKENPGITIIEVTEILGVPRSRIIGYLKQERLEIKNSNEKVLVCKNCGVGIRTGIFCEQCKKFEAKHYQANTYTLKDEKNDTSGKLRTYSKYYNNK